MMAVTTDSMLLENPEDRALWVLLWAAGMVMLVADLTALHWLGMWEGLTAKNPTRAALDNAGCILLLPWAGVMLGMLAASLLWPNADERPVLKFFLALWFVLSLAADLGFGAWARHRLLTAFRIAATQRINLSFSSCAAAAKGFNSGQV